MPNQNQKSQNKSERGFASMDEDKQRDIARKGGESMPDDKRSFSQDRELASEAGRKGGESRGGSQGGSGSGGGQRGSGGGGQGGSGGSGGSGTGGGRGGNER